MAADPASADAPPPCPDPSAHEHHHDKLSAQASTAALYATGAQKGGHSRNSSIQSESVLGPDGRLSSKSAATSLKYAKAQDLPSFPSSGNASGSASKAAMLAKDYKMKDLWQPEQSKAGSKAAVLAANKGAKLDLWQASASAEGQSAATLAFRNKGLSPQVYGGNSAENKGKALQAATKSTQQSRARATSTPSAPPEIYPDQANSGKNALNAATAATVSTRNSALLDGWNSPANQAARVTHLGENVSGKMFTGNPDWQYEEDKHQAALKASAVMMAKSLYANQNRQNMLLEPDGSDLAGARSAARNQAVAHPDVKQEALQYISLQDTAHRLAAERLAKIDKDMESQRFREHYGYGDAKPKRLSSRISMRSSGNERRGRQRASSDGTRRRYDSDSDSDDERQAGRIRAQMAGLSTATRQVDSRKQQDDRAKLLAAAEKRVSARMQDMDSKVYRDTGKVSPAMMEEWEAKARERAERDRQERALNPGKTHIGGGQFMDQSEIEAIAAARLKPTLDEISATAASRRQRDEELRIEKDKQQTARMEEKIAQQAEKDRQKAIKNDLRDSAKREKAEERARKEEDKRKSREVKRDTVGSSVLPTGGVEFGRTHEVHDETEDTAATDGREKHQSALARLKAKFRATGSHEKPADKEADKPTASGTVLVGGAAAGAVTGATLANLDKEDAPIDAQQASHAVAANETAPTVTTGDVATPVSPLVENEKQLSAVGDSPYEAEWKAGGAAPTAATTVIGAPAIRHADSDSDADGEESLYEDKDKDRPVRPAFAQTGSVSGFTNDAIPTVSGGDRMATLERHISHIPESDASSLSSDNEDWNEERTSKPVAADTRQQSSIAPLAAVGATAASPAATTTDANVDHPARTMTDVFDAAPAPAPAPVTAGQSTADSLAAGPQTPGVPIDTSGPDTASMVAIPPASVTASPTTDTTTLKQAIKGEENLPAVVGVPAHETTEPSEPLLITENTKNGPLDHPLVTATDVSAAPAAEVSKKEAEKTSQPTTSAPTTSTVSETKHESDKDGKGVRGFFSKLKSKTRSEKSPGTITAGSSSKYDESKYDNKSVPYESTKAGDLPTTNNGTYDKAATDAAVKQTLASQVAGSTATASTIPPIDTGAEFSSTTVRHADDPAVETATKATGVTGAESPSSFTRGEARPGNTDDVSSSGAEEEDLERGRGGGGRSFAKKLGFGRNKDAHVKDGKLHKPPPGTEVTTATTAGGSETAGRASRSTDDENDNFEEARDHFDESLVPPPAFAGQKKSQSPVRETRFKEDV